MYGMIFRRAVYPGGWIFIYKYNFHASFLSDFSWSMMIFPIALTGFID